MNAQQTLRMPNPDAENNLINKINMHYSHDGCIQTKKANILVNSSIAFQLSSIQILNNENVLSFDGKW